MTPLFAIAYLSTARSSLTIDDTRALLEASKAKNVECAISGVLLYCNGTFMQYFEGPRAAVLALYARVQTDSRHHGLIELFHSEVQTREFGEWSMGYVEARQPTLEAIGIADWAAPNDGGAAPGRMLLGRFWRNNC